MSTPSSVEEYLATFAGPARTALEGVRSHLADALPDAVETISYGMPTLVLDGRRLVHFAGWKHHLSVYPAPASDAGLLAELAPYESGRGTLKFPLNRPIPYGLIVRAALALAADRRQPPGP